MHRRAASWPRSGSGGAAGEVEGGGRGRDERAEERAGRAEEVAARGEAAAGAADQGPGRALTVRAGAGAVHRGAGLHGDGVLRDAGGDGRAGGRDRGAARGGGVGGVHGEFLRGSLMVHAQPAGCTCMPSGPQRSNRSHCTRWESNH